MRSQNSCPYAFHSPSLRATTKANCHITLRLARWRVLHEKKWDHQHTHPNTQHKHVPKIKTQRCRLDPRPTSNLLPRINTHSLQKTAVFKWMMGQRVNDVSSIKTQCTVSGSAVYAACTGAPWQDSPCTHPRWQWHARRLKLPRACPSAHDDSHHWKWNRKGRPSNGKLGQPASFPSILFLCYFTGKKIGQICST